MSDGGFCHYCQKRDCECTQRQKRAIEKLREWERKAAALDKLERMKRDVLAPDGEEEPGWFIPGIHHAGRPAPTILEAIEIANETEAEEEAWWEKKAG